MIIAGIYGTSFVVVASILALWSLWWIIKAAKTNPSEREAEDEARERVARGEGWADENGSARVPFTDAEIAELSASLSPEDPADAGIDARPKPDAPKRRFNKR